MQISCASNGLSYGMYLMVCLGSFGLLGHGRTLTSSSGGGLHIKAGRPFLLWMTGGRRSKGLFTFDSGKIRPPRSEVSLERVRTHVFRPGPLGVGIPCSSVLALPSSRQAVVEHSRTACNRGSGEVPSGM